MECEWLNGEEVRISLSPEEIAQCGVPPEQMEGSDLQVQAWIRRCLRGAEEQIGRRSSRRMVVRLFPKRKGGVDLYVSGWLPSEGSYYLFDSLEAWLQWYSLQNGEEKGRWDKVQGLPSGRWLAHCSQGEDPRLLDFASPLVGEYLSFYLSEHRKEL